MSKKLSKDEFIQRNKELSRENLKFIYGIIKAISLGAGTIAIFNILFQIGINTQNLNAVVPYLLQIILFAVSWFVVLVSYDGIITSTVFSVHIPNQKETFYTFLLVIFEILLFAVLSPKNYNQDYTEKMRVFGVTVIDYWFLFFSVNAFIANRMLKYALYVTSDFENKYDNSLKSNVEKFREEITTAKEHSFLLGLITFFFFLFLFTYNNLNESDLNITFYFIFSSFLLGAMIVIFIHQHKKRNEIFITK